MNNKNSNPKPVKFYPYWAEKAVKAEQAGDKKAVDYWARAAVFATHSANKEYAEKRSAFCKKWLNR